MAYYPGNYYQTRHNYLNDYYSQSLFSTTTASNSSSRIHGDPYWDDNDNPPSPPHPPGPVDDNLNSPRPHPPPPSPSPHHRSRSVTPLASAPAPALALAQEAEAESEAGSAPSSSYLKFASVPSKKLSEPTRKLLVLDLNGTLLLRSPRPPKSYRVKNKQQYRPFPAPRRVMRRPYLLALRAYLFAPQTRAWLDVMVWSSAQPHSVDDMVHHAFGNDRDRLVAIWARDTLGLAEDLYHRKVLTIKDLEKPWAALAVLDPSPPSSSSSSSSSPSSSSSSSSLLSSSSSSSSRTSPASRHQQHQRWSGHSAATTILLDDSHAKAARQPYNHLCVSEYTRKQRQADLAALQLQQLVHDAISQPEETHHHRPHHDNADSFIQGHGHKRKRGSEEQGRWPKLPDDENDHDHDLPSGTATATGELDNTLLAVIGILHAVRLQSSIAGWLCAGALLSSSSSSSSSSQREGDSDVAWFEDPVLVSLWAKRGREAMHSLGLQVDHGVEP